MKQIRGYQFFIKNNRHAKRLDHINLIWKLNKRLINFAWHISFRMVITDKRAYILDVAERLFAEQGFEAVSIREISRAADINIAMVSYYFGSKEKLYEDIIRRKLIPIERFEAAYEEFPSHYDKLIAITDVVINSFFENRYFQIIVFREMSLNQRTHMADFLIEHMQRNFLYISEIVKKGIKKKEFKPVDVELTVMSIFAILRMYATSGTMISKIMNKESVEAVYDNKQKNRVKGFIADMLTNHLLITE